MHFAKFRKFSKYLLTNRHSGVIIYLENFLNHISRGRAALACVLKGANIMDKNFQEFLPLIIPLIVIQFLLLAYTLRHIFTHENYRRGNRAIWVIVSLMGMEFIGPILYLVLGKEED